jgi:hypothetical protein
MAIAIQFVHPSKGASVATAKNAKHKRKHSPAQHGPATTHLDIEVNGQVSSRAVADIVRQCADSRPHATLDRLGIKLKFKPLSGKIMAILSRPISSVRLVNDIKEWLKMLVKDAVNKLDAMAEPTTA